MSLHFKKVNKQLKEFEQIKELMNSAFPKIERMPMWFLLCKARKRGIDFLALYDERHFVGVAYLVTRKDLTYISYLAIGSNNRSKGYGTRVLETIRLLYPENRILVSIEPIDKSADNYEQRVKRKSFYTRNGFVDAPLQLQFTGCDDTYEVLFTKGSDCSAEEYKQIYKKLYGNLLYYYFRTNIIEV